MSLDQNQSHDERNAYLGITFAIQIFLGIGLALFVLRRDWENVFLTTLVILLTLLPNFLFRRYRVLIPPEFQLISAVFIFLSLFLGSAFDFYYRYWWWDLVLHTSSGFLLGVIGFVAIFVLNGTSRLPEGMSPSFICFFGVTFAVTLGVVWEAVEFAVDCAMPAINMQSRETGVYDTMQDLIVDTAGAVVVAFMGYAYLRSGRFSFLASGVRSFVSSNRRLLRGHDAE
jgi:hypothetical protein